MRNLPKIFWVVLIFIVVLWAGVGIYYLKSTRSAQAPITSSPNVTVVPIAQPTESPVSENLDEVEFIIGNFVRWEEIEGSQDRYILLTDPKTNKAFPKIRVGFEFSSLYGYEGSKDITVFAVEKGEEKYDVLYALKYYSEKEIDQLIKKRDWIKIYFKRKLEKEENVKDDKGTLLAHWLIIKREGGKAEVEQEIDRKIQEPEIPNL